MGIDCAARAGIHVWEDHYVAEIVNPTTGASVPDGEEGELVVSTLTREGLPLLRYRTHDLTRVVARTRCDCGRTSLRLDRLRGRTDDMVIFKGVNFYPRQIERLLLGQPGLGPEYQIVLDADGGGERMTVLVEANPGSNPAVVVRVRRALRDLLSLSPEIRVCLPGELERPQGKAVRVVDRRPTR
jgi:phenylacetate-CoA ligase